MFAKFTLLIALACCLLGALSSCQKETSTQETYELSQQTQIEGVSLHLQVSQSSLKTSERARVVLDIKHDPRLEITLPELEGQFGDFTFAEVVTQPARLDSQSWVHLKIGFLLEPDLPGESTLLPFEFVVENPRGEIQKIHTKPIAIQVLSVGVDAETSLRDIAPDERAAIPESHFYYTLGHAIGALAVIIGSILFLITRRKKTEVISAQLLANFLELGRSSKEEILQKIEPFFCLAYSEQVKHNNRCSDFDSLCRELSSQPSELAHLVSRYESAQYGKQSLTTEEISELYQQFSQLLDTESRKVVRS